MSCLHHEQVLKCQSFINLKTLKIFKLKKSPHLLLFHFPLSSFLPQPPPRPTPTIFSVLPTSYGTPAFLSVTLTIVFVSFWVVCLLVIHFVFPGFALRNHYFTNFRRTKKSSFLWAMYCSDLVPLTISKLVITTPAMLSLSLFYQNPKPSILKKAMLWLSNLGVENGFRR